MARVTRNSAGDERAQRWADPDAFRSAFQFWLDDNLSSEWRHQSFDPGEERASEVRRTFGKLLGEAGWLTVAWPTEQGGLGFGARHRLIVLEELTRAGAPEPMNINALGIFAPTLMKFGRPEQCARFLPPMVRHEVLWCQGFSEPGAGSDLASLTSRATISDDAIVISGQKVWTTNAHRAQYCYLLVRTESGQRKQQGLSLVALPMDQPGVKVRPLRNIVGTTEFCEIFLDEARAPLENLIGEAGDGWRMATFALAQERSVGLAQRSLKMATELDALVALTEAQAAAGSSVANDDLFAGELVDRYVRARVVEATVRRTIEADGDGKDISTLSPVAKIWWSEGHQLQLDLAMRIWGARAVEGDAEAEKWWKTLLWTRAETIYGGTSQVQRNLLARQLGMPRGDAR